MKEFKFTLNLNVMEHLGENLYSSIPAVIAETIANSYDADAKEVRIDIDNESGKIMIQDNGNGMTEEECNKKYLNIGYHRREVGEVESLIFHRPVMGRKGIGKLSLFSIAKNVELHSVKVDSEGNIIEKNGFIMNLEKIKNYLKNGDQMENKEIPLETLNEEDIKIEKGTKIILTDLKRSLLSNIENFLKRRLARKFSVLGQKFNFRVFVNSKEISIEDRDYFDKIQYLWHFGKYGEECLKQCKNVEKSEKLNGEIILDNGTKFLIEGWIGTVNERSNLPEGENTILLHSRGKSIHDDILKNIDNSGIVSKYIIGEITAEFLDNNDDDDITTSDRQSINENTERFEKIRDLVKEIMTKMRHKWQIWREDNAIEKACEIPAIKKWFEGIEGDNKKYAKQLFGKIDKFTISDKDNKKELYKTAILAFQSLAIKQNLSKIEDIDPENIESFLNLLGEIDQLESAHYHDIVKSRMEVLKKFEELVDKNVKERVLQEYLFNHLWLLDPSWERADSKDDRMETTITKIIKDVKLNEDEKKARLDIYYRTSAGEHIIIELKKFDAYVNIFDLQKQVDKYRTALMKGLKEKFQIESPNVQIIIILGSKPSPKDKSETDIKKLLDPLDARYITYDNLINKTIKGYGKYLEENKKISDIEKLIAAI